MSKTGMLFLLAYLTFSPSLLALTQPEPSLAPAQSITLGNPAGALTGPWKFAPGDSPWVHGAPLWA
jgi:hypothetical protein